MIERVFSKGAPRPIGPYSQAVKAGGFVFVSAQLGVDPETEVLAEGVERQASVALANVSVILRESGSDWGSVVRVTLYLADISSFAKVNEVYSSALGGAAPARSTLGVSSLPKGALVALDAIAWVT